MMIDYSRSELPSGRQLAAIYLLLASPVMLILCFLTQPLHAVDEPAHFLRVVQLSEGSILPQLGRNRRSTGSYQAEGTRKLSSYYGYEYNNYFNRDRKTSFEELKKLYMIHEGTQYAFVEHSNTTIYFPLAYAGPVAAVSVARLVSDRPLIWLYCGRLANALTGLILTFFALRYSTQGRFLFFTIAMLPVTLFQGASLSADTALIPSMIVLGVLFNRIIAGAVLTRPQVYYGMAAAALVALGKIAYLPLAALSPIVAWTMNRRHVPQKGLLIGTAMVVLIWTAWSLAIRGMVFTARHPDPGNIDVSRQLSLVLSRPWMFVEAFRSTLIPSRLPDIVISFAGARIGWLEKMPRWIVVMNFAMMMLTLVLDVEKRRFRLLPMVMIYLASTVCAFSIFLLLYLQWNPVASGWIDGVQGRYFLPLLPTLVVVTPALQIKGRLAGWLPRVLIAWGASSGLLTVLFIWRRYWIA